VWATSTSITHSFWLGRIIKTFAFGVPFAFWKAYFHKIKGGETPRGSCSLNTTYAHGLTESFSASAELHNVHAGIYYFCFWNFFSFFNYSLHYFWPHVVKTMYNKPTKVGLPYVLCIILENRRLCYWFMYLCTVLLFLFAVLGIKSKSQSWAC
jgi:hypothetical protein